MENRMKSIAQRLEEHASPTPKYLNTQKIRKCSKKKKKE